MKCISKVLIAKAADFKRLIRLVIATKKEPNSSHIIAGRPTSAFGKSSLSRGALLDVSPMIAIKSADTFVGTIYAGSWSSLITGKPEKEEEKISQEEDRSFVDYAESVEPSHYKKDYSKMSKEDLLVEIGCLNTRLDTLTLKYIDLKLLMFTFTILENHEDEFTKYELSQGKGFAYDYSLVNKLKDFFDKIEEKRRQRWLHYLLNPPSSSIQSFVNDAKNDGFTEIEVSVAVASAVRTIAVMRHNGYFKGIDRNYKLIKANLDQFTDRNNKVIDFMLKRCNLDDSLFTVEKKV